MQGSTLLVDGSSPVWGTDAGRMPALHDGASLPRLGLSRDRSVYAAACFDFEEELVDFVFALEGGELNFDAFGGEFESPLSGRH